MKKLLGWFTAVLFLLSMAMLTIPHLILIVIWSGLRSESKSEHRKRLSSWSLAWGRRYLWMVQRVMQIDIEFDIDYVPKGNYIIIANHRTVLDHEIIALVAKLIGINDIRWVLKSQMRKAPVVGWLMEEMGCAFVSRSRDPSDMDRIREMTDLARSDNASVMIYPEGTRFSGVPKEGSSYTHVRDPKLGGFKELCGNLHTRRVLVITIDWGLLRGGRTMWDGDAFVGHHIRVHVHAIENPGFAQAEDCLKKTWAYMDQLIAARGEISVRSSTQPRQTR